MYLSFTNFYLIIIKNYTKLISLQNNNLSQADVYNLKLMYPLDTLKAFFVFNLLKFNKTKIYNNLHEFIFS